MLHEGVATAAQHKLFGESDLRNEVTIANRRCDAFKVHAEHAGNLLLEAPPQLGFAAPKEWAGYRGVKLWIASLFAEADQPPDFRIRSQPYRPHWCDALSWPHELQMLKDDPFAASVVFIDWLRAAAEKTLAAKPPLELSTRGFEVKAGRIDDELARLADLLESIANGEADDISGAERVYSVGWQIRTDAALHVARLQALLNHGSLDFADCDFPTMEQLKSIWSLIKMLDATLYSSGPNDSRDALFLPNELEPRWIDSGDFKVRGPDEPYDVHEDFGKHWDGYEAALKVGSVEFPEARQTETKREAWGWYPDQLRSYAKSLARPANPQAAAAPTKSEIEPPSANLLGDVEVLPQVNLKTNQVRYGGECLDVTSDGALLISKLVESHPHAITASKLFTKPSDVKNRLPTSLRKLIKTESGKGYWLNVP